MDNNDEKSKAKNILLNIFLVVVILISGVYLYARYIEPSKLIVKEYKISRENIPSNFSGIKIVHFTDLYWGNTTHNEEVEKLVKKINELKPDLILFTGNLTNGAYKSAEKLTEYLTDMTSVLGKYAIKGNEDFDEKYISIMSESGFKILQNEYELIYNDGLIPIYLCGLNSSLKETINLEGCLNYFEETENEVYKPNYKIIMTHEGDNAKILLNQDISFDLILSGNSLNGTINLPYYGPLFLPKGSEEYFTPHYKRGNTHIYISSGIGTAAYPYRLLNPPSFNLYRLKSL